MRDRKWTLRMPFGEVRVELLSFPSRDREASGRWERELQMLLRDARRPEVRRVLEQVYDELQGNVVPSLHGRGPDFEQALERTLRFQAYGGGLRVERVERVRVVPPVVEQAPEEVLGPDTDRDPAPKSKSWVGMVLLDQNGTPVPGRAYRVVAPDGTVLDGQLDSNATAIVKDLDPGSCKISCPYVEPHPKTTYTVQPGDHISGIAQDNGFDDYTVVWNDPDNADLAALRADPHVLQPGDMLTIPELKDSPVNKPTGNKHTFTVTVTPLKVRIKVLDRAAKPLKNVAVTLAGTPLTTDGNGLIETQIDKAQPSVDLQAPQRSYTLDVGAINPSDDTTPAGYKARLFNLGFLWDPNVGDTDDEMIIALQDFQAEYSLTVSGELDDSTKSQLTQAYGS